VTQGEVPCTYCTRVQKLLDHQNDLLFKASAERDLLLWERHAFHTWWERFVIWVCYKFNRAATHRRLVLRSDKFAREGL
jgi:hypothetical protein